MRFSDKLNAEKFQENFDIIPDNTQTFTGVKHNSKTGFTRTQCRFYIRTSQ